MAGQVAETPSQAVTSTPGVTKPNLQGPRRPTAKDKRDASIMDTNSSCIVSKRCVEKVYFQDEPGLLRHFVKKFQRRSPLISRGYYLRCLVIEQVIADFLQRTSGKRSFVVNLGCGFDTVPIKFIRDHVSMCNSATFVDVDYESLMQRKAEVLRTEKHFLDVLTNLKPTSKKDLLLESDKYLAVACDLHSTQQLDSTLSRVFGEPPFEVLFIAEVSITYMEKPGGVIAWAAGVENAEFCLLEQYLPDGDQHPFAQTMLKHFRKLNSPLRSACEFPSAETQTQRFVKSGWHHVHFRSMWEYFKDASLLSRAQRQSLDEVEPFDELEEFALFASHYFVIRARQSELPRLSDDLTGHTCEGNTTSDTKTVAASFDLHAQEMSKNTERRRYAASCQLQNDHIIQHGGYGEQSRLTTVALSSQESSEHSYPISVSARLAAKRLELMAHTLTSTSLGIVCIGGRTSPARASASCHLVCKDVSVNSGTRVLPALPTTLYRHSAVAVGGSEATEGILVFGGRVNQRETSSAAYYLDLTSDVLGWIEPTLEGDSELLRRFGASSCTTDHLLPISDRDDPCLIATGYFAGGCKDTTSGIILTDFISWRLTRGDRTPTLHLTCVTPTLSRDIQPNNLGRFGATLIPRSNDVLLIGGVGVNGVVPHRNEVLRITSSLQVEPLVIETHGPRPLLIGHSAVCLANDQVAILGGGAVCFSFGTYWNRHNYILTSSATQPAPLLNVDFSTTQHTHHLTNGALNQANQNTTQAATPPIPRTSLSDVPCLKKHQSPLLIPSTPLGQCLSSWPSHPYLLSKVPPGHATTIHTSKTRNLSFQRKNFKYITIPFHQLLSQTSHGAKIYMRSTSSTPTSTSTSLSKDWPWICEDFKLPAELEYLQPSAEHEASEVVHSSPLRISGDVNMWLHYDVQANIYCYISGPPRRFLLFDPRHVEKLGFEAGASTSSLDIFAQENDRLRALAQTVVLKPGDVLFIPSCWLHAAGPADLRGEEGTASGDAKHAGQHAEDREGLVIVTTSRTSIAVNIFFPTASMAASAVTGKDIYANRDVPAYLNGRRDVEKIRKAFDVLPEHVRAFYLKRLAGELGAGFD